MNASAPFGSGSGRRSSRAFTLIELLVVIGIIGILMAILMPALGAARKATLRQRAATEVKNIEAAILSYLNDYGKFPMQPGLGEHLTYSGATYANLIRILRADPSDPSRLNSDNPLRKVYLQVKDSSIVNGAFVDPWENNYYVRASGNFDNDVQYNPTGTPNATKVIVGRNVIVWSNGPKANDTSDNIKSFED